MKMPEDLEFWTADEVAECLSFPDPDHSLYNKLWRFLDEAKEPTPRGGDGSEPEHLIADCGKCGQRIDQDVKITKNGYYDPRDDDGSEPYNRSVSCPTCGRGYTYTTNAGYRDATQDGKAGWFSDRFLKVIKHTMPSVEEPAGQLDSHNDDKAPHWWNKLTEEEQAKIAEAYRKEYAR